MPQQDFTQGAIGKQMLRFALPIMLANLLQAANQFIDSLWVGNLLGVKALGAVSVSAMIIFVLLAFVIGINNAALTILSQQKGRDNHAGLKRYLNAFVVVLLVMAVGFTFLGVIGATALLHIMGTPSDIFVMAHDYLQINFIGAIFLFGYNFISTVLRALGDSKSPLTFVLVAVVLNTILDPVFISVFGWGVAGAAIATVLSQGVAFGYGLTFVLRKRLAPFQLPYWPKRQEVATILRLGIPAGLQMAMISAGSAAIMGVVTRFGSSIIGGYGAAQRLDRIILLPALSLGSAVNSMAGQNIGVRLWQRVSRIAQVGLRYNLSLMVGLGLVVFFFAGPLIRLFINDPAGIYFATNYLRIMACCFPFLGINFVLNGIVRGAGAMYQVLVLNIISFWVLRFPLAALGGYLYGDIGIPLGIGLAFMLSSLCSAGYYRFGRWREIRLEN